MNVSHQVILPAKKGAMPSFIWDRDPSEAYSEPYEYPAQEQFVREAIALLDALKSQFSLRDGLFRRDELSREKSVWMLEVDALEALADAIVLIGEKKHRMASRLFRDALETQDLAFYFAKAGPVADGDLKRWYGDDVIPHRVAREFVKSVHGNARWEALRELYGALSKYTHRTYSAVGKSYVLGRNEVIFYDGFRGGGTSLVLPHVISFSYAVLAMLIRRFMEVAVITGQISQETADQIWSQSMEPEPVPRRFVRVIRPEDVPEDLN
ncbi:hypothetical protein CMV30_13370 [Nibricoccus aquaticus]|uniref:Uncharacterized protein n=1 Tax=Nibricoccus aquaticus TaxID=2576891 RepID=A0A290QHR1_9BACT|nr:hypothetical protein [Nibricoccus aquaticus]ATC64878.1 hypothetical protein CMV30_13370 [Nibricoccus aquaticus]